MNGLPLHPAIVHIPLGISLTLPIVAIALLIAIWRRMLPHRAWAIVLLLEVIAFGGALVARETGEKDQKKAAERVGRDVVETHEERANILTLAIGASLALAAVVLFTERAKASRGLLIASAIATCLVAGLAAWTGEAGGQIAYGPAMGETGER